MQAYYQRGEERDRLSRGGGLTEAGLEVTSLLVVEGPGVILPDLEARMTDPADRAAVLDGARALENVPELADLGPHLLATAVRGTG